MKRITIPSFKYKTIADGYCCDIYSIVSPQPSNAEGAASMLALAPIYQLEVLLVNDGKQPDIEAIVRCVAIQKVQESWHWVYTIEETGSLR